MECFRIGPESGLVLYGISVGMRRRDVRPNLESYGWHMTEDTARESSFVDAKENRLSVVWNGKGDNVAEIIWYFEGKRK